MITVLSKIFLANRDITDDNNRKAYGSLCGIVGIFLNIMLFVIKYIAGAVSGSVAIVADAFNNLSDAGSSFITLVGFIFSGKRPDYDHPFGHGRFEYISGFVVSIVIILMGLELVKSSFEKIIHPEPVEDSTVAIIILIISILVKIYMCFYNRTIGKKISSTAMLATATDSLSDSIATTVVLISIFVTKFLSINVDGYCGVLVALFILYAGFNAAKDTISPILGKAPEPEFVRKIEDMVLAHTEVIGVHDLVVHDYGPGRVMISLHAEVDGDGNIFELHDAIDRIENELSEKLDCEAVIHLDPIETNNEEIMRVKKLVLEKLKEINENISIHDFRMVTGNTHTNLIFDVVIPYEMKEDNNYLKEKIISKIKEISEDYIPVIHLDRSYIDIREM